MNSLHFPTLIGALVTIIGSAGVGGIMKTWLDHKRGQRAATDEVALTLVAKLEARVNVLEHALDAERAKCEAELRIHRHRSNNLAQMVDAMLLIFDMPIAKRSAAVQRIREQRAQMMQGEAIERAAVIAAPLPPARPPEPTMEVV